MHPLNLYLPSAAVRDWYSKYTHKNPETFPWLLVSFHFNVLMWGVIDTRELRPSSSLATTSLCTMTEEEIQSLGVVLEDAGWTLVATFTLRGDTIVHKLSTRSLSEFGAPSEMEHVVEHFGDRLKTLLRGDLGWMNEDDFAKRRQMAKTTCSDTQTNALDWIRSPPATTYKQKQRQHQQSSHTRGTWNSSSSSSSSSSRDKRGQPTVASSPSPKVHWTTLLTGRSANGTDLEVTDLHHLIANQSFLEALLHSESSFLAYKFDRYRTMKAKSEKRLQYYRTSYIEVKQAMAQSMKSARLAANARDSDALKAKRETLTSLYEADAFFDKIMHELNARIEKIGAALGSGGDGAEVFAEKRRKMLAAVAEISKIKGESRKSVRAYLLRLIVMFAESFGPFCSFRLNIVITGSPGQGKSFLAERISGLFHNMGVLHNDVVYNLKRSDLVAGYIGQTTLKTRQALMNSLESCMFVDEAYTLPVDEYGGEAMGVMLDFLSEYMGLYSMIVAGYKTQMETGFFDFNPGLRRRFPTHFDLQNYTNADLVDILIASIEQNSDGSRGFRNSHSDSLASTLHTMRADLIGEFSAYSNTAASQELIPFPNQAGDMLNLADVIIETSVLLAVQHKSIDMGVIRKILSSRQADFTATKKTQENINNNNNDNVKSSMSSKKTNQEVGAMVRALIHKIYR